MPPRPTWLAGFAANEIFYRTMFRDIRPGRIRLVRTTANGQAAFGFYRPDAEGGPRTMHAIQLVATREGKLWRMDHFMQTSVLPIFGLPREA
jgi:RNA polymerase sigma-70 factor (ECF subfamily)